jgi:hypothetical protein
LVELHRVFINKTYARCERRSRRLTMAVFMGAFPVLPGKEEEPGKFAQETLDRSDEFDASQRRYGVTKEEWALQKTPMGTMVLVRFESPDIEATFAGLGESSDAFDEWFKGRVLEITGVDLSAPSEDPLPEIIFSRSS